jgi:hypothetical protein
VNDKVTDSSFGSQPLNWTQGGTFKLKKGLTNIKITRIDPRFCIRCAWCLQKMLVGRRRCDPHQLVEEVKLLKEYKIPNSGAVKFGDVNGDGLN